MDNIIVFFKVSYSWSYAPCLIFFSAINDAIYPFFFKVSNGAKFADLGKKNVVNCFLN